MRFVRPVDVGNILGAVRAGTFHRPHGLGPLQLMMILLGVLVVIQDAVVEEIADAIVAVAAALLPLLRRPLRQAADHPLRRLHLALALAHPPHRRLAALRALPAASILAAHLHAARHPASIRAVILAAEEDAAVIEDTDERIAVVTAVANAASHLSSDQDPSTDQDSEDPVLKREASSLVSSRTKELMAVV